MLCKCHCIVLYTVHFTAFCLGAVFSRTRCRSGEQGHRRHLSPGPPAPLINKEDVNITGFTATEQIGGTEFIR